MKKIALYLMAVIAILFAACDNEIDKNDFTYEPHPIPVTGVSLDFEELTLALNSSVSLVATVTPERASNQNITWNSSNLEVVTVNENGGVSAVGLGEAIITVITEDGELDAVCAITVVEGFPVIGITLNKTELALSTLEILEADGETVKTGTEETLLVTFDPENATTKQVKWSTSDATIATVDDAGKVTAIGPGEATITVTSVEGEKTATCKVTVIQPVTGVELDAASMTLVDGETKPLGYTVLPENATNQKVNWSVSGVGIEITVDAETGAVNVTRVGGGEGSVTVITEDGGFTATCSFPPGDPNAILYGVDSKDWTWASEGAAYGNGELQTFSPNWWGVAVDAADAPFGNADRSKDGKGAFMTFKQEGHTMMKTQTDAGTITGTFNVDMSSTKNMSNGAAWSIGTLTTKDVTILWGVVNDDNIVKQEDMIQVYELDIIKATENELVLGTLQDPSANDPWSGSWYWLFKAK